MVYLLELGLTLSVNPKAYFIHLTYSVSETAQWLSMYDLYLYY